MHLGLQLPSFPYLSACVALLDLLSSPRPTLSFLSPHPPLIFRVGRFGNFYCRYTYLILAKPSSTPKLPNTSSTHEEDIIRTYATTSAVLATDSVIDSNDSRYSLPHPSLGIARRKYRQPGTY